MSKPKTTDDQIDRAYYDWIDSNPEYRKNHETAKAFLQENVRSEDIVSNLRGIDLTKPVEVTTLQPGTVLELHERTKRSEPLTRSPDGDWLTEIGTSQTKLGLVDVTTGQPHIERKRDLFVVDQPVTVLKSQSRDFTSPTPNSNFNPGGVYLEGGEIQYLVNRNDKAKIDRVVHPDHAQAPTVKPDPLKAKAQALTDAQSQKKSISSPDIAPASEPKPNSPRKGKT